MKDKDLQIKRDLQDLRDRSEGLDKLILRKAILLIEKQEESLQQIRRLASR